jgi:hypothetical protein
LLGLAYGLVEEGLADQSLFNPHYLHLRLLDYGYVDALGTGLPWLIYVLTIHVVWSICVPIGLVEALFPARRGQSWLGPIAIGVFALLCAAGLLATAGFTHKSEQFMASPVQLGGTLVVIIGVIVAAFLLPRPAAEAGERPAPPAWLLFVIGLVAGLATLMCRYFGPSWGLPWIGCVAAQLAIAGGFAWYMFGAAGGRRWSAGQRVALVTAGLAVYGLFGIPTDLTLHGPADLLPHCAFIVLFLALAVIAIRKARVPAAPGVAAS